MFDLSVKEVFFRVVEERGGKRITVVHYFRSPTSEDWFSYFGGVNRLGLSKGRDTVEFSAAAQERDVELWETLVTKVEGYVVAGQNLMEFSDWKAKVPIPHKLNAISGFLVCYRANPEVDIEEGTVLDLAESDIELTFGVVQFSKHVEVTHTFKMPDASDYLKYTRAIARMQLVRTKQRGVSDIRVPSNIHTFVDLYAKLIKSVKGYVYEGKDVMEVSDWIGKIDTCHKREAVRELLGTSLQEEEEG
jgi:hypothetical protein